MKYLIVRKHTDDFIVLCKCGKSICTSRYFTRYYIRCNGCFGNVNFFLYRKGDFIYEADEINDFIKSRP